jgi:hypothetical protein
MPKISMDYQKTIIYKICCNDLSITDLYVGSTTNFIQRKYGHKSKCNNEKDKKYNIKVYQNIRENGGWNNWTMIEIEKYPCLDVNEATARERYWYEELQAKLNSIFPNRPKKEYYEANKDKIKETKKKYYEANKDKINK